MGALHSNKQFSNGLSSQHIVLSFTKRLHSSLDKEELLLEIIEADTGVDFVPVCDSSFQWELWVWLIFNTLETAINSFIIKNVKQLLEEETVTEVLGELVDFPTSSECKDTIQQLSKVMSLLNNTPPWLEFESAHVSDSVDGVSVKLIN